MAKKELGNRLFEGNVDYSADSSVKLLKAAEAAAASDQFLVLDSTGVLKKVAQPAEAAGRVEIDANGPHLHVSGVNAAAYGSSSAVPVITINDQGLITAASTAAISTSLIIGADSGSDETLSLGDSDVLDIVGDTNGGVFSTVVGDGQTPESIQVKLKMDINDLAAGDPAALATADELAFADASSSNATKKISLSDLLDGIAGAGIARNGATLELKPSEFTEVTPSVGSDSVTLLDDTGAGTYASDVANQSAGASFNWLELDSGSPGSGFAVDNYLMDQFDEPTAGSTQFSTLSGDARKIVAVYQTSSKTWIAFQGGWMNGGPPSAGRYLVTFAPSSGGNTPSASQVAGSVREVTSSDIGSPSSGGTNWTRAIFRIPFSQATTLTAADHALKHSISGTQHGGIAKLNVGTVTIMNNRDDSASEWSLSTTAFGANDSIIHIDNGSTQIFPDDGDSSTGQDSVSLSSSSHDFFAGTYTPTLVARKATLAAISSGMAGDGLGSSSGVLSVGVDGSSLEISSDALRVKASGVTNTMLANSTITMQADSGDNQAMSLGETFDIAGGTGISSVASSDSITLNLDATAVSAGSYGDAGNDDKVPSFTVDAQGRLTAAGHTSIDIAHTQVNDFDAGVRANRLDQMAAPTAAVVMNSQKLTGVSDPTAAQDGATKAYVDAQVNGMDLKDSVKVATTASITLSGTQTIDGVSLSAGDRVLVKDQSTASENGVYVVVDGGSWTRATDFDIAAEFVGAPFFMVDSGAVNGAHGFVSTHTSAPSIGSDSITFYQFSAPGQDSVAGAGLAKSGNVLSVNVDDSSLEIDTDSLRVKALGITNAMLAGSIANAKLVASTISGKALGTNLDALAVDDSSIEYSSGTAFNGSAASTIGVKALGITNGMLAGSIAAGKLAGSIPDSKLNTIATANKVSGAAVQLASASALEDSSGLRLKAATAGDGIDMTSQVLKVDVKANGGLVIESNKLAIDLAASSFTNQLADSDLATIATANKVSGSAVQLTSGGSAIEDSSGLRLKAATAGEGLAMDSAQVLSIAHDSLSLDPKSDGNTFEVKGHNDAKEHQVARRGADNAPLSWVYPGLDVEFKLDYTNGTPAVAASYSTDPDWLKYNDSNVASGRVAIQLTHTDLFGAGMPDGYVVQLFLVDDSTSQQLVGTDTKRHAISGLVDGNAGLNGGWVSFDLEDVSASDSNVTFKMSVVAAPKAVAGS